MHLTGDSGVTSNQPATPFEQLPTEVLLQILSNLYSLDLLWDLMRASPRVWRIFDDNALKITEDVISGPESTLSAEVQDLVRNVILVRSKVFPYPNLDAFRRTFSFAVVRRGYRRDDVEDTFVGPECLRSAPVTSAVLRSTVATASHLLALSQACLASALARIRDPSFKPLHCTDPNPDYGPLHPDNYPHDHPEFSQIRAWDRVFSGTPAKMVDAGQPSWVEDMRALRAMWALQLIGEARCLFDDEVNAPEWPERDILHLKRSTPVQLFNLPDDLYSTLRAEEATSALYFLDSLGESRNDVYFRLPRAPKATGTNRWTLSRPKVFARTGTKLYSGGHILLPTFIHEHDWGQTVDALNSGSHSIGSFLAFHSAGNSPVGRISFDPFRPLGFAFWDKNRLYLLGLCPDNESQRAMSEFHMFAWESILDRDLVLAAKTKLREEHLKRARER